MIISEIAEYLETKNVGTVGTDIFISRQSDAPNNQVVVYDTGGIEPDKYLPTADPTFQVLVRNTNYQTGQGLVNAIVTALHQFENGTVEESETYFYYIFLVSEPTHIGRDDKGRHEWSINFVAKTRREDYVFS